MDIQKIELHRIHPNKWNPNVMDDKTFRHLKHEYKRIGYLQPILVRKIEKGFELIDGYHRWKAYEVLGKSEIEAVVVEMTDAQAKITTVNMNKIKGELDPIKFAELLDSLKDEKDLSELLNMSKTELEQYKLLLTLPNDDELLAKLKENADEDLLITCPKCGHKFEFNP